MCHHYSMADDSASRARCMNWVADLVSHGVASSAVKHLLEGGGTPESPTRTHEVLESLGANAVQRPVLVAVLLAYARERPGQLPRASRIMAFLDDPADRDAALTYALDLDDDVGEVETPIAKVGTSDDFVRQWN